MLRGLVVLGFFAALVAGCGRRAATGPGSPPPSRDDGWQVADLQSAGLDVALIDALMTEIERGTYDAPDALLIARNGRLVYEQYWTGFDGDALHDLRSATKSVTSALSGLVLSDAQLDTPIESLLPGYTPLQNPDARKSRITPRHLLSMNAGLSCDDWQPDSPGNEECMYKSADWVRFILDLPAQDEPGARTAYCTGGVVVLGAILEEVAKQPIPVLAQRLFTPLGITSAHWAEAAGGRTDTGGHLELRARDFAKLGQLFVDGGRWHGNQVVSEAWIATSTAGRAPLADGRYGYLWWVNTFTIGTTSTDFFFARGNGGQHLFVFPSLSLVVLFLASAYNQPTMDQPIEMTGRYILRAALK